MFQWLFSILGLLVNFVFMGSKAWVKKNSCAVKPVYVADMNLHGFLFYPSTSSGIRMGWFPYGLGPMLRGKLAYAFPDRNWWTNFFCDLVEFVAKFVPNFLLPTVPNTNVVTQGSLGDSSLPLIVWSHGRGGNVADHALMLSQLAVQVPAVVCAITHTDGSADCFRSENKHMYFYRTNANSTTATTQPEALEAIASFREYQVELRVSEIFRLIEFLETNFFSFSKIIFGGFDLGGATALLAATQCAKTVGCISIDGTFCVEDRVAFPKNVFGINKENLFPSVFILSDEWEVWHKPVTQHTERLVAEFKGRQITVKQTKHFNFTEIIFWVPLKMLLRLAGVVHRRGDAHKTYRRTTKWMVGLMQQFVVQNEASYYRS